MVMNASSLTAPVSLQRAPGTGYGLSLSKFHDPANSSLPAMTGSPAARHSGKSPSFKGQFVEP